MILNDEDIRKYCTSPVWCEALGGPMIDPFTEAVSGNGVIGYGLSSHGYDIRLAGEVYCLKSSFGEVIDPKLFRDPAYKDRVMDRREYRPGERVIIPANGYILGTSVERFNMPATVCARVLGKSTLARCFSGKTRVALVDGSSPTFEELVERSECGEDVFYGYGYREDQYIAQPLVNPRMVGDEPTLEIILDNEEAIRCTADHKFMLRGGRMRKARRLRVGDSLQPLRLHNSHGYEAVYNPSTRDWTGTHHLVEEMLIRHGLWEPRPEGFLTHHIDGNKRNNHPSNIMQMSRSEHVGLHNRMRDNGALFRRLWGDPEWRKQHLRKMCSPEVREKAKESLKSFAKTAEAQEFYQRRNRKTWNEAGADRRSHQAEIARRINLRADITKEVLVEAIIKAGTLRGAARILSVDRTAFRRFPEVLREFREGNLGNNHKVAGIREMKGKRPVYCLTAPDCGNFALASGVMVSNCGVVVNVTPLECGWRGQLTIEISNAGPAPVAVYAYEGIAQVLFEALSSRPSKTYADKNNGTAGKYQDQCGVVLARVL